MTNDRAREEARKVARQIVGRFNENEMGCATCNPTPEHGERNG